MAGRWSQWPLKVSSKSNYSMILCYLNHPWALLKATLLPAAFYHRFGFPHHSEPGCLISCDFRTLLRFIDGKNPTLPEGSAPQKASQVSYIHTILTAEQHLFFAISRSREDSTEIPFTPTGFSRVCWFLTHLFPYQIYKLELPLWLFIQCVWQSALRLYCCELFAHF